MKRNETTANPQALVVGGTSGLGLSLAKQLYKGGYAVAITGQYDPAVPGSSFFRLSISGDGKRLSADIVALLSVLSPINLLVYTAGFSQLGVLGSLTSEGMLRMTNISLAAPAILLSEITRRQEALSGAIFVTSTSQWIPRKDEPLYAAGKAGLAMLCASAALDPKIQKILVAGPAGMDTKMQMGRKRADQKPLLSPEWVASEILRSYKEDFHFRTIRILRDPPRVEILS